MGVLFGGVGVMWMHVCMHIRSRWCFCVYINTHNHPSLPPSLPPSLTNGPHQQVRVLQRRHQGQVALPRRQHVQQELVERDGQGLERRWVAVDELCGGKK
jgi:hypothetical protein